MKKMKIAVLGTQASGKGTQSHILSVLMGVPPVSVGDLLRDLQNEDSDRGRAAKTSMAKGSFVADEVIMPLMQDWLIKHPEGWLIDGFPRSVEQAQKSASFFHPDAVIYLEIPDEESKRRISYRRVCAKCKTNYNLITQPPRNPKGVCDIDGGELVRRADDTPELVEERLRHYHAVTEPVKQWFATRGLLLTIDGKRSINEVANEVQTRLESFIRGKRRSQRRFVWIFVALGILLAAFAALTYVGYLVS
jgi:adenylate kinase